jgi:hypothetical protein
MSECILGHRRRKDANLKLSDNYFDEKQMLALHWRIVLIRRTARGATGLGVSGAKVSAWDTLPMLSIESPTPDHLLMRMPTVMPEVDMPNRDCVAWIMVSLDSVVVDL